MQRNEISTVNNITKAIANPAAGDVIFLDIDETLLLTGFKKFSDDPKLTEPGLPAEILRLQERGIRVVGLTSRSLKKSQKTLDQLKLAGMQIEVLHAPDTQLEDGSLHSAKGKVLHAYLEQSTVKPKRVFVFDNLRHHLEAIKTECADLDTPLFLKHYVNSDFQPVHIDAESNTLFPEKLEGYQKEKSLGGGTASVFYIKHTDREQPLVLKLGAHEDGAKVEMLCNAVYRILGVDVPKMRVYHTLPKKLAADLGLKHPYRFSQLCEFIQSGDTAPAEIIRKAARDHFVVHALLGNIDVAKEDNFIVDKDMKAYLIDAGANFIFRSLGQARKEAPNLVSELETLRDKSFNDKGPAWFGDLTDVEIALQLQNILAKSDELTAAVWSLSQHLQLSDELRDKFLQCLSDRIDVMVTRYLGHAHVHAKVDKRAAEGKTAAGILTYALKGGEPHILLSKRVRHEWWDNFGGKSEDGDETLLATAQREVAEESGQVLNYTDLELLASPFHDIVTGRGRDQQVYRMYISQYDAIEASVFKDDEHTAHQWVPLKDIIAALDANQIQQFEGQDTVVVKMGQELLPVYPPLFTMLQQQPVRENLDELLRFGKMKCRRTLGYASVDSAVVQTKDYRPFITPVVKRQQIAATLAKKSRVIRELKCEVLNEETKQNNITDGWLSQSEIHLKAILDKDYQADDLAGNVRRFIDQHLGQNQELRNAANKERLVKHAVALIENEKKGGADTLYFYHACSNSIAFAYDVYASLYRALQQDARWAALRPDSEHFQRFLTINEFVAHYSGQGKRLINNNEKNYNDCAVSANVFLFGNYATDTSCSINYLINNDVRRQIDLSALFTELLQPFHVSAAEIKRLLSIFTRHLDQQRGSLYQIAMPASQAKLMSYPAGYMGVMNALDGSVDLPEVLQKLREKSGTSSATPKEYIKNLQARVMLPPTLPIAISEVRWKEMTETAARDYHSALTGVVNALVHKILCHHGALSNTNAKTRLVKVLPAILRDNQVSYSVTLSDVVLLKLIMKDDAETLKRILRSHPELLHRTIHVPKNYIECYGNYNDHDLKTSKLADMILQRKNIPLEVIVDFSEESWASSFSAAHIKKGEHLTQFLRRVPEEHRLVLAKLNPELLDTSGCFIHVLDSLPRQDRSQFARSNLLKIKSLSCVANVTNLLPECERVDFVKNNLQVFYDLHCYLELIPAVERIAIIKEHHDLITQGCELAYISKLLPKDLRFDFVVQQSHKIFDVSQLRDVTFHLPEEKRLAFVTLLQDKIKTAKDVAALLEVLDESAQLPFANANLDKIKDGDDLYCVVQELHDDDDIKFLLDNQDRIKAEDGSLASLMFYIPQMDCLDFATRHESKITEGETLVKVITLLMPADRLAFANRHFYLVNNCSLLCKLLLQLPAEQRLNVAHIHQDKMKCEADLCNVLKLLPESEMLEFVLAHYRKLFEPEKYKMIVEVLPDYHQKLGFVMACGDFLEHYQGLYALENVFDKADHFKIITANLTCFNALSALVLLTPDDERLELVGKYGKYINSVYLINDIIKQLPQASRLSFLLMHQQLITTASQLLLLIVNVSAEHVLILARAKRSLITSKSTLVAVCSLLADGDRDAFMLECINSFETLHHVVTKQAAADKFDLVLRHIDLVTTANELFELLFALPDSRRLEIARLKRNHILCSADLCSVLSALHPSVRCVFASEQNLSHANVKEMLTILRCLPEDERIDYIYARIVDVPSLRCALQLTPLDGKLALLSRYQHLIKERRLSKIMKSLPDELRLIYANAMRSQISAIYYLGKVVGTLKLNDRFAFAMECKEQMKDYCSADALLKHLPDDKKLLMANALLGKINNEYCLTGMTKALPAAEQLPFILANMKNRHDFLLAIGLIDIGERLAFARRYVHLISMQWELAKIVALLPAAERMAFVMEHQAIIQSQNFFGDVLQHLTPDEALILATAHQEQITTGSFLNIILDRIPPAARMDFTKANIRNADLLSTALRHSPLSERTALAIMHQHLIKDYYDLRLVLFALPRSECLAFAIANQDKPHVEHLSAVTSELPTNQQWQFISANCKDGNDLVAALGFAPDEQRLAYAVQHQDKIESLECLESVGNLLGCDKDEFMKANRERVEKVMNSRKAIIVRPISLFEASKVKSNEMDLPIVNNNKDRSKSRKHQLVGIDRIMKIVVNEIENEIEFEYCKFKK